MKAFCPAIFLLGTLAVGAQTSAPGNPVAATVGASKTATAITPLDSIPVSLTLPRFSVSIYEFVVK